jgi:hypothetical protein
VETLGKKDGQFGIIIKTTMRRFVKKNLVKDYSFSEIDFDLHEEFGFDHDVHDGFVEIGDGKRGSADAYPIKIDRMMDILQQMKNEGVTHVELDYHIDHIGYDITGWKIQLADQKEIDEVERKEKAHREKMNKKKELLQQLADLEKEDKKPDSEDFPF